MNTFNCEILSAIPQWEIIRYFKIICDSSEEENIYSGPGWCVQLELLAPKILHSIRLPQTKIVFTGNEDACKKVVEAYRKAFMRGGA